MEALRDLVAAGNIYIDSKRKNKGTPNRTLLENMASYITHILKVIEFVGRGSETTYSG